MRIKKAKKLVALLMAMFMVIGVIPVDGLIKEVSAAGNVHVFESSTMTAAAAGTFTDGQEVKYDDYFTLYMSAKTKIDSSEKVWDDGYTSGQRLNLGGKADLSAMKNVMSFKTSGAATVKIWWVEGGDDHRELGIFTADGAEVTKTTEGAGAAKNGVVMSTLKLDAAGTYFLGGTPNNNYIFKVEVEESAAAAASEYVFEASTMAAAAAGTFTDGQEVKYDDYFTIYMSSKTKIDSSEKAWDDGYTSGQRLNLGGKADLSAMKNVMSFKTSGAATVNIWWVEGGDDHRELGIFTADGTQVAVTTEGAGAAKNGVVMSSLKLDAAGTYFLGGTPNNNYIFKVQVIEGGAAAVVNEYVLESNRLAAAAAGTYTDGQEVKYEDFFTLYMSAKTKIDSSEKVWDDGYTSGQRINLGGKADLSVPKNVIMFKTEGTATVNIWWVEGGDDHREIGIFTADGTEVTKTTEGAGAAKNGIVMSTLTLDNPGTYYLGGTPNNNYIFKLQVIDTVGGGAAEVQKKAWAEVDAPVLGTPALRVNEDGTTDEKVVVVPYTMLIDEVDGADYVEITVTDKDGKVIDTLKSLVPGAEGSKEFKPTASGTYTFAIAAYRDGEDAKKAKETVKFDYVLPLAETSIGMIYNKGNGEVSLSWSAVKEAESYTVEYSADGSTWTSFDAKDALEANITGLTVGTEYTFRVIAKRGDDSKASADTKIKITAESQTPWGYIVYGTGASTSNSNVEGSINTDGKVQLTSGKLTDGKLTGSGNNGKLQPASYDGLQFYYTTVPTSLNFKLRAKVTVDQWYLSNGQEGFGLMAADQLGGSGWNNSYMAVATKVEYYWNDNKLEVTTDSSQKKVSQKLGIGSLERVGITKENLPLIEANDTATLQKDFTSTMYGLEQRYPDATNVIGNSLNVVTEPFYYNDGEESIKGELITEMYLTIERNNTGYFVTYETADGSYSVTKKYYDRDALSKIDEENVYVGFFAARYAQVTFSDVTFSTSDPATDAPAEEKPVEKVAVNTSIKSPLATGNKDYTLKFYANCDGTIKVNDGTGKTLAENVAVKAETTVSVVTTQLVEGNNNFVIMFTPDANYVPGDYMVMESYNEVKLSHIVEHKTIGVEGGSIYVAPGATGDGSKENPMSVYEAVKFVLPGQTIILKEGVYGEPTPLKIEREIDGTAEKKIYMIADPEAKTRPVFNFGGFCTGITLGGDYWVLRGFDVTRSADGQKGLQISGNYNLVDSVNAYYNGNTGIQISRYSGTDLWEDWPKYNTILNCTSYGNADNGYEDADGFAAKLTVGEGNVFDGCIAHHNADDGCDLYAKVQTGTIGSVTIKNSVAYANGYLEDGTLAGNGNGFKLGGESLSGKHVLENCVAYDNKNKGIDSNSCPDIIVKNCISFNNGAYNVALYTNTATNTDYSADGIISFRTDKLDVKEQFKLLGSQDTAKVYKATNYYWDVAAQKSVNNAGAAVSADWFKSLDTSLIPGRNADNTINMNGLLELTDKVPAEVAAAGLGAGQPSEGTVLPPTVTEPPKTEPETTPEATTPAETVPNPTTPEETTTPEATTPEETTPEATTPEQTTPADEPVDGGDVEEPKGINPIVFVVIGAVVAVAAVTAAVILKKKGPKKADDAKTEEPKAEENKAE